MRQHNLFASPDPIRHDDHDPDCERDLFGNPIVRTGPAAPTYRPRKPVQQSLDLAPGHFTLGSGK
jgi:hypothetical protein